ncbi:MAG: type sorting protein [Mucilaginibacter sp.]|nr:type sorting protein [Mucilaginibacter sp.]
MALPLAGICQLAPSTPKWVTDMGGPNGNCISAMMKVDAQNNIYITGSYSGTVDFDPSLNGVKNLTAVGSFDGYIAKYNTNGLLIWAVSIGGTGIDQPSALDLDANGNIIITGQFDSPTLTAGAFSLQSAGGSDAFIIRLDNSGSFVWGKTIGGTGNDVGNKIVSDASGNLVEVVQFQSTVNVGGTSVTAKGATDGLIIKYDQTGNVLWNFSLGATGGDNSVIDVLTDKNKNIVVSGYINGTVDFNPLGSANNVSGENSMYVAQYSPSGILIWVNVITGTSTNYNYNIHLCADAQNNIYVDGMFAAPLNFGTAAMLTPTGNQDIFLAKYSDVGAFQWYKDIGGVNSSVNNYGLIMGGDNNIYITGDFAGTINFNSLTSGVAYVADHGIRDMFLAKYDLNGSYIWAFGLGNSSCGNNLGRSAAAVNSNNDVLLTGSFCSTVNFDGSNCVSPYPVTAQSSTRDLFIAKYTPNVVLLSKNVIFTPQVVYCELIAPTPIDGNPPIGGGAAVINYQWIKSSDDKNYTDITGATSKNYNPPKGTSTGTTYYRRNAFSATCATPVQSNVIAITFTLDPPVSNNIISNTDPDFCGGNAKPSVINGSLPTGGTKSYNYQWQKSSDNISFTDIAGAISINYDPPVIARTTYFRRLVTSGVCSVLQESNVITITLNSIILNNSITAPAVVSFCGIGDPANFAGSTPSGGNGAYTYQWQSSADNVTFTDISGATAKDYDPPIISATTYYRRLATSAVCSTPVPSNTLTITINTMPTAVNTSAATICVGSSVVLTASGGSTYQWSPALGLSNINLSNPTASPPVTTTYTVLIGGVCTASKTVTVTVIPKPIVNAGADKAILGGGKTQLNGAVTSGSFQYRWSPTTYLDNPNILNPVSTPLTDITYTLTATSAQGCFIVSDDVSVKVYKDIVIPNTFTPNGDGINDTWDIGVLNTNSNMVITVYNRNGTPVFKSIGYIKAWDGKYKGSYLPFGTYYYTIDIKDGSKPLAGWVSLIK